MLSHRLKNQSNSTHSSDSGDDGRGAPSSLVELPRFGVAIFDDSRESGWASLPDGDAFRFRQPSDLPSNCIWVTSSEGPDFRQNWGKMHHLRPSDYISKLKYIAADFGVRMEGEGKFGSGAQKACQVISPVLHRAMVIAAQAYGWNDPVQNIRMESLAEDLRECLSARVPHPPVRSHMRQSLQSAWQSYSVVSSSPSMMVRPLNSVSLMLRHNRLEYAQKVMETLVPDDQWTYRDENDDKSFSKTYTVEWALNPERPCLVNATVEFAGKDAEVAALCAYGNSPAAKGGKSMLRTWISQPELAWISKHARVNIHAIRYSEWAKPLPKKVQLPELLVSDPLFTLSVSAGLVAEAHWQGLAKTVYNRNAPANERTEYPTWAVWLRAADRAYSFELALAAYKQKFYVAGYGNGAVNVFCEKDRLSELLDFAMENRIAHPVFSTIFEEHGLI